MQNKHRISKFDVVAFIVFLSLALVLWSFARAISLVKPTEFQLEIIQPVGASAQELIAEPDTKAQEKAVLADFKAALEGALAEFSLSQPNDFAIYVKHLGSGVFAEHNGQLEMTMASLYKPFVAVEVLKLVDQGQLSLRQAAIEDGRSVEDCLADTIIISDNQCGRALLSLTGLASDFGREKLQILGYKDTDLRGYFPTTTARDVAKMMENIVNSTDLSSTSRELITGWLSQQKINDRLSAGLPSDAAFAHKTGDLKGYIHDAGIVSSVSTGKYVVVAMSGPDDSGRLTSQRYTDFGELAQELHRLVVKYSRQLDELSS